VGEADVSELVLASRRAEKLDPEVLLEPADELADGLSVGREARG
jgi:hypothetical protein